MVDIDKRKSPFKEVTKQFPSLYRKAISEEKELRKENEKIVKRILQHRTTKAKEEIVKEAKAFDKYRKNLRKIKGKQNSFQKLHILR